MKKLLIGLLLISSSALADNIGLDYQVGTNSLPSYGIDFTKNYHALYLDYGVMKNSQVLSPSISGGLQLDVINFGLVLQSNVTQDHFYGLGGMELGFTEDLGKFYLKLNNQVLRDVDSSASVSSTLSAGINL